VSLTYVDLPTAQHGPSHSINMSITTSLL